MKTKVIVCLSVCLSTSFSTAATNATIQLVGLPMAKVTVRVIDENERAVENANVSLGFGDTSVKGVTDVKGISSGEGIGDIRGVGCTITKDGYYRGTAPIPKFHYNEAANRWEPWNETYTAILRPLVKPIALYAKKIETDIPALNQPCGYDLETGDWVMPYGKGMKKDLIFTIHQQYRGIQDYDLRGEMTFANSLDGLLEVPNPVAPYSVFKWERQAPENGYQPKFLIQNIWSPKEKLTRSFKSQDVWEGYFFRVRTVEQNNLIVSAHYGKIRGGIAIYARDPKPQVVFSYYYNPTPNDRNLEWDMKKNLFGGLTDMEAPREP